MQLMTFNSLLLFDIVFVFFLFLVGVTCLVYYLPPSQSSGRHACKLTIDDDGDAESAFVDTNNGAWQRPQCPDWQPSNQAILNCTTNKMHVYSPDVDFQLNDKPTAQFENQPSFCYIKAKYREIRTTGPIQSV